MRRILLVALILSMVSWELQSQKHEMLFFLEVPYLLSTTQMLNLTDFVGGDRSTIALAENTATCSSDEPYSLFSDGTKNWKSLSLLPSFEDQALMRRTILLLMPPDNVQVPNLQVEDFEQNTLSLKPSSWLRSAPMPGFVYRMINPSFELVGVQTKL